MARLSKRRLRESIDRRLRDDRPLDDLLAQVEPQRLLTALLGFTCRPDDQIKMNALAALGGVALRLAEPDGELRPDSDLEPIREFCRRLLWHINEESGGVGWGAPQALAEVLIAAPDLVPDYLPLVWSFLDPDGAATWKSTNCSINAFGPPAGWPPKQPIRLPEPSGCYPATWHRPGPKPGLWPPGSPAGSSPPRPPLPCGSWPETRLRWTCSCPRAATGARSAGWPPRP